MNKPLFIFDIASNHYGNLEHGLEIVRALEPVLDRSFSKDFDIGIKLQYRNLPTLIHPDYINSNHKTIRRDLSRSLTDTEYLTIKKQIKKSGFVSVCTAFDETSVSLIAAHEYDYIKIASSSFLDQPLTDCVFRAKLPVIASTAGASWEDIDLFVSRYSGTGKIAALLHCVAEYPTALYRTQLNQLDNMKRRYPFVSVGLSSHERAIPNTRGISVIAAIAKGATTFERHIGLDSPGFPKLNDYSMTPLTATMWLHDAYEAFKVCGVSDDRYQISDEERANLRGQQRGIYAARDLSAKERGHTRIGRSDVDFMMPALPGIYTCESWSTGSIFMITRDIRKGEPLTPLNCDTF